MLDYLRAGAGGPGSQIFRQIWRPCFYPLVPKKKLWQVLFEIVQNQLIRTTACMVLSQSVVTKTCTGASRSMSALDCAGWVSVARTCVLNAGVPEAFADRNVCGSTTLCFRPFTIPCSDIARAFWSGECQPLYKMFPENSVELNNSYLAGNELLEREYLPCRVQGYPSEHFFSFCKIY